MFKGYLLKVCGQEKYFEGDWIIRKSYKALPNQRTEITAYRDDYTQDLTRITAPGLKTKITFTIPPVNLKTKMKIKEFFKAAEKVELERKVYLTYWNDEDDCYKNGYFYIPDLTFTIDDYTKDDIMYESLEVSLVEY